MLTWTLCTTHTLYWWKWYVAINYAGLLCVKMYVYLLTNTKAQQCPESSNEGNSDWPAERVKEPFEQAVGGKRGLLEGTLDLVGGSIPAPCSCYYTNGLNCNSYCLQNPQFHSTNTYIVFAQLLKQLSQLPSDAHWCLIHWLRGYRVEWFRDLIAKIQQFISIRLFPSNPSDLPSSSKCTWWIPSAVKVLALLSK